MEATQEFTFTLNGEPVTARVDGRTTLLRYLRDDLGLVGTKDGCSSGDCGSCVVLVDGKPVDACVYLMRRSGGVSIETIEGLAKNGTLHPIQAAFLDRGAVQCGFCIPGMIMASKALLERNASPSRDEIRAGLKDNICRCTGFEPIFEAVEQASAWLAAPAEAAAWKPTVGPLGSPAVLVDGARSVQGQLPYADDVALPGMLHGAIVWSEHAYARILGVDTKAAKAAPGVHRIAHGGRRPGAQRPRPDRPRPAGLLPRLRPLHRRPDRGRPRRHPGPRHRGGRARQGRVRAAARPVRPEGVARRGRPAARHVRAGQRLQGPDPRGRRRRGRLRVGGPRRRGPFQDPAPGPRLSRAAGGARRGRPRRDGHRARADPGAVRDPRAAGQGARPAAGPDPGHRHAARRWLRRQARDRPGGDRRRRRVRDPQAREDHPDPGGEPGDLGQASPLRARLSRRRRRRRDAPGGRREARLRRRSVHRQQPPGHRPGLHLLVRPVPGPERPDRRQGGPDEQPARRRRSGATASTRPPWPWSS